MAKKLIRMEIEPAENGGHTVTHHYKEEMKRDAKSHAGISMGYQEPERHVFGGDDGHGMLAHVATHLGIDAGEGEASEEGQESEDA
jgi:hypothetical protein